MNPYFKTPPVVKNLLIANIMMYMAITLLPSFHRLMAEYGQLYWVGSPYFRSWQFVSYMFLHASLSHLFFNMWALWMFGRTLEYEIGSRRFLIYYMVCGVGAAILQMGVAALAGEVYFRMLGASGAVMGLLLSFGVMHPNERLFIIPIPFPIKAKWFVVGYAVLEMMLGWTGANSGVAHFAHVGGMLWGLLLLLYWRKNNKVYF